MFWMVTLSCVLMIKKPQMLSACRKLTVSFSLCLSLEGSKRHFLCSWRALTGWAKRGISFSFPLLLKCPRGEESCCVFALRLLRMGVSSSCPARLPVAVSLHSWVNPPVSLCRASCLSSLCIIYIPFVSSSRSSFSPSRLLPRSCHDDAGCLSVWLPPFCWTALLLAACCMTAHLSASLHHCFIRENKQHNSQCSVYKFTYA